MGKRGPDLIEITVHEHRAFARWGADRLLSGVVLVEDALACHLVDVSRKKVHPKRESSLHAGEFNLTDGRFTVADGAWFNAELAAKKGSPTHNPFLTEQLLVASIRALEETYGLQASAKVSLTRMFQ